MDSVRVFRLRTDAPVLEMSGVVADGSYTSQTLIVDGELVLPKVLSSSHGTGGWNAATVRVDFGTRKLRDVWIETSLCVAYFRIDASDVLVPADDPAEPQMTVIGDSYLQSRSNVFGNGSAIALELAARLGIRKVATDCIGGTGYWNSGGNLGNLNDRLQGHGADGSTIYLVTAGLNDYGDLLSTAQLSVPTLAVYEESVNGYLQKLRAAQPEALIVVTAPFCPVPSMSDSSYQANPASNTSGLGDFLYKARVHENAIRQIAGPWVYIDVLLGGGWTNSAGKTGDVRGVQWFTGGTPGTGTTTTYKPGSTTGGAGGGYGGVIRVPVVDGGRYEQAPEITATGGSGSGLLVSSFIDKSGSLTSVVIVNPGSGYTSGAGLPSISVDRAYEISAATLGTPVLEVGVNPGGGYPLPSMLPPGVSDLNNVYRMLMSDKTHPSPLGVDYLSTRLAISIFEAVTAL